MWSLDGGDLFGPQDLIKNTSATEEHRKFGRLAMEAYK